MRGYKIISADAHIAEPPDLYTSRIDPRFRDRAPRIERRQTPDGTEYDAWFYEGKDVGKLGAFVKAGQRFEDPTKLHQLGLWEDVRKAAYDPHEMLRELEIDGVWGGCMQPSQGLFCYKITDNELVAALCRAYNDWIADFCKPYPGRLKGIACIDGANIEESCQELERCAKLGLVASFIPVYPLPDKPYRDPIYDRLWWTAQDLGMPLLLHIGSNRSGIPGCEFTINPDELTRAGFVTFDHWVRYSLSAMIFAGVFDRYPQLTVGTVEHEMAWIPHWLKQMDFTYTDRPFRRPWTLRNNRLPSDHWRDNMFAEFMEDDIGIRLRDIIGVDNMLWGNDFPHAESTWPKSMEYLDKILSDTSEEERQKITSTNAKKLFKFAI